MMSRRTVLPALVLLSLLISFAAVPVMAQSSNPVMTKNECAAQYGFVNCVAVSFAAANIPESPPFVVINGSDAALPSTSWYPVNSAVELYFMWHFSVNGSLYVLSGLSLKVPGYSPVGYPAQNSYRIPLYYNDTTITAIYNLASSTTPSTIPATNSTQPSTQPSTIPVTTTPSQGTSPTPSLVAAALVGAAVVVAVILAARKRRVTKGQ